MSLQTFEIQVNIPDVETFCEQHKAYRNFIMDEGEFLYQLLMTPESFIKAKTATDDLELPAVAGIAKIAYRTATEQGLWNGYVKQCIGALICTLMEANDYEKTGRKRSIPHPEFSRGEVYKPKKD